MVSAISNTTFSSNENHQVSAGKHSNTSRLRMFHSNYNIVLLLEKKLFCGSVLRQLYGTCACPHLWPSHEFQGRSLTEVAVCVKVSPIDGRLVACASTGLPRGHFLD